MNKIPHARFSPSEPIHPYRTTASFLERFLTSKQRKAEDYINYFLHYAGGKESEGLGSSFYNPENPQINEAFSFFDTYIEECLELRLGERTIFSIDTTLAEKHLKVLKDYEITRRIFY